MDPARTIRGNQGTQVDAPSPPAGPGAPSTVARAVPEEDVQYDGGVKVVTRVVPESRSRVRDPASKMWRAAFVYFVLLTLWDVFDLLSDDDAHPEHRGCLQGAFELLPAVSQDAQDRFFDSLYGWPFGGVDMSEGESEDEDLVPDGVHMEIAMWDPLDDLSNLFMGHGLESSDTSCEQCFDNDSGRVRQAHLIPTPKVPLVPCVVPPVPSIVPLAPCVVPLVPCVVPPVPRSMPAGARGRGRQRIHGVPPRRLRRPFRDGVLPLQPLAPRVPVRVLHRRRRGRGRPARRRLGGRRGPVPEPAQRAGVGDGVLPYP